MSQLMPAFNLREPGYNRLDMGFQDPALEHRFMTEMVPYNKARLMAALGAGLVLSLLNIGVDLAAYHPAPELLKFFLPPRLLCGATILTLMLRVRRAQSAAAIDLLSLLTALVWITARVAGLLVPDPAVYVGSAMILGAIFVLYFGMPVRFALLLPVMLGSTVLMVASFITSGHAAPGEIASLIIWLAILHGLSLVSVRSIRGTLRRGFAAALALEHQAMHDTLTGLANRRCFEQRLEAAVAHALRMREPLSLITLDIDHFKYFNDTLGHGAGDQALRDLAAVFTTCTRRPADLAARTGGEEFSFLLPNTAPAGAERIAQTIRDAVNKLALAHPASPTAAHVTVSLGVATSLSSFAYTPDDISLLADRMLYAAKMQGRDSIVCAQLRASDVRRAADRTAATHVAQAPSPPSA